MSDTMDSMATEVDQQELARQLLAQAKEQGIEPAGPDGSLNRLTKNVPETALEAEMDEHPGYGKHDVSERGSGNSRNDTRACARSAPRRPRLRRRNASSSSPASGAGSTRRSAGCRRTPGASSCRSWTTT